jgi:integrase
MRPVAAKGRRPNAAYRVRENLTESEMDRLLAALKRKRHGQRDWLIGLLIYRHGLRVSEACDLRWDDVDLTKRTITLRRLKGSDDSRHDLERDELAGLKALQRGYAAKGIRSAYVFVNERAQPFEHMGIARMVEGSPGGALWLDILPSKAAPPAASLGLGREFRRRSAGLPSQYALRG